MGGLKNGLICAVLGSSIFNRAIPSKMLISSALTEMNRQKDLGALVKKLEGDEKIIAANSANIIARLHARAKPVEQELRELIQIREKDAELVVQCIGTILCELDFAEWM
ncbi:MAG: hypothetical protein ACNYPF_00960 [Candidatus Puniceispirillales bacterium WSBS_2018_MAG_OTU23]